MEEVKAEGGCMCGNIRYKITGEPVEAQICHCPDCRKATGAHCVAWVYFPIEDYVITKGTPAIYKSCPPVERTFCDQCGTSLTYSCEAFNHRIAITIGSLDTPENYIPKKTCSGEHKLSWASPI